MFLLVSGRHVGAHTDGHQHGVSIQISINLVKKFLRISRIRKIAVTRILARVFVYLLSFDCQILDFIYWPVLIFILIYFEFRDTENQQYYVRLSLYLINCFCQIILTQLDDHTYVICSLKCAILDRSTEDSRQRNRREEANEFLAVPGDLMGFVIGNKGSSIKEIEMESGAKLNSHSDQGGFLVSGNKEQRTRAKELVQQKVVSANLVPRVFVPLDQRSENESSGSNHFRHAL